MRRLQVGLLAALLAAGCAEQAADDAPLWGDQPAEPLDLRGELSAREVPLLGELGLTLDLYVGAELDAATVEFEPTVPPDFSGRVERLPIRTLVTPPAPGEALPAAAEWRRYRLFLRPTKLGELTIPPFEVRLENEGEENGADPIVATTARWTVVVTSLLADAGAAIEAPDAPFPERFEWWPWLVGVPGALALVAALWWLWRRRAGRSRTEPAATPLAPHVKALRALARLRQAPRSTPTEVEAFYVEVSLVLRVYLEDRFGMHAPERTTEEFLAEVEPDTRLDAGQRVALRDFLSQCDLVKFAGALPREEVHARTFDTAETLVEATRADRAVELREGAA